MRLHLDLACVKLNDTQEEFKETTTKLEHKIEELQKQLKEKVDAQAQLTTNLSIKLDRVDREISELKEASPPYMWKIDGFREMLRDAKRGRDTEIESGHFFSGPNGYKLMAIMYPNGVKDGRNTYLSVFVCILRGKFDAVLPWPFRQKVTVTLIDQQANSTLRVDQVDSFSSTEDPSHRAFARPPSDGNCGYGFPTFISQRNLFRRRYIVDDTLFLQIQVGPPSNPFVLFG